MTLVGALPMVADVVTSSVHSTSQRSLPLRNMRVSDTLERAEICQSSGPTRVL